MNVIIDLDALKAQAGAQSWLRGETYYRQHRVSIQARTDKEISAHVKGSEIYYVRLILLKKGLDYRCSCPVNADGSCCKHIVAVALAATQQVPDGNAAADTTKNKLKVFLQAQPPAWLADTLFNLSIDYPDIERQLSLQQQLAGDADPTSLKKIISSLIGRPRHLDYRKSRDFSFKIGELHNLLLQIKRAGKLGLLINLCEYALERLIKVYAESDDSAGYIGGEIANIGQLYSESAMAASLADKPKPANFFNLLMLDDWGLIQQDTLAAMLGAQGLAELERKIETQWASLKPNKVLGSFDGDSYRITQLMESIALQRNDIDFLIRLYSQELEYATNYHKIIALCQSNQRQREAILWAERGVKAHPKDNHVLNLLAEMYRKDGLEAESLAQIWQIFLNTATDDSYLKLKENAGLAWPIWREKALGRIIKAEQTVQVYYVSRNPNATKQADCSLRASCLLAEGCLDELRELLHTHNCTDDILLKLARTIHPQHPQEAATHLQTIIANTMQIADNKTYQKAANLLKEMRAWLPQEAFIHYVELLRLQHKAKRNFINLLHDF
jgi:uncharacterized Zn finger protein